MSRVVALDTNIVTALLRGETGAIASLLDAIDDYVLPVTVYAEVMAGLQSGANPGRYLPVFEAFLSEYNVQVLETRGMDVARSYARLYTYLRQHGTPISPNDLWLAAECVAANLPLFSLDTDFARVPHIRLYAAT
jgi:predicted nucleic acid-binding protein